jgi:hypothetical protein
MAEATIKGFDDNLGGVSANFSNVYDAGGE